VSAQPYGSSYFLPGKLAGKAVTFLLDTGCTTNLLSRRLFDTLSARDRASLEPYDVEYGTLADGSCSPFYGVVELTGRVRDQVISETFIVSQLKENAILGMPFLQRHRCRIDFSKSAVMMARAGLCPPIWLTLGGGSAGGAALYCTWPLSGYSSLQSEL